MFETVQLPTGVTNLNSRLSNVDRDTFTLKGNEYKEVAIYQFIAAPHSDAGTVILPREFTLLLGLCHMQGWKLRKERK